MLAVLALAAATALPTIQLSVRASADASPTLVTTALEEADAIWRQAGMRLSWTLSGTPSSRSDPNEGPSGALRVVLGDEPGVKQDSGLAIGWVVFHDGEPRPEIHLSYANALTGFERACTLGALRQLMTWQVDAIVAVGIGRALAHELGHYLLGSAHSATGLMHAHWSPLELFIDDRPYFRLDATQRAAIASKLSGAPLVTQR